MSYPSASSATHPLPNAESSSAWRSTTTYGSSIAQDDMAIAQNPLLYRPAIQVELNDLRAEVDQLLAQMQAISAHKANA